MRQSKAAWTIIFALVFVAGVFWIFPIILLIMNSVKPLNDMMNNFLAFPTVVELGRYKEVWDRLEFPVLFLNTLVYTVFSVIFIVLLSAMAAYKLSRTKTKLSSGLFLVVILPMIVPFQSYMITLTRFVKNLNLLGNRFGYIFISIGLYLPMAIFLLHGFVKSIPIELDECAYIDGASKLRTFFSIIMPLMAPILVTVAVIDALGVWNDMIVNMLVMGGKNEFSNIQNALYVRFSTQTSDWETALPGLVISIIPNIIFFVTMQKYIVKGLIAGAVKG